MKLSEVRQTIPVLGKLGIVPLLHGSSGIGKTETVGQVAKEQGMEMVILNLGTQEVGDLLGLPDFSNNKTEYKVPSWWPTDPNSKGILFLDEINRARRDVLQAVFSLVLEKRIHTNYLPKGWWVVAAANPNDEDHVVTDISDNAFLNRFCHIIVQNDLEEWAEYSASIGTPSVVTSFALEQRSLFQDKHIDLPKFTPRNRRLTEVGRIVSDNSLSETVLFEVIVGMLGTEAGTAFMSHRKDYSYSVKGSDVVANFAKDKKLRKQVEQLSTDHVRQDVLNVTCIEVFNELVGMDKVGKKVKENVIEFLMAIPKEMSTNLVLKFINHEKLYSVFGDEDVLVDYYSKVMPIDELKKAAKQFSEASTKEAA